MFKFPYSIIYYRNFTFFSKIFFYLCINKIQNTNIDKNTVTGIGLCDTSNSNEGFWCNNILLKDCYDWNTYNNIFIKYANYEDHKKECQRINKTKNVEIGQGTCELNQFEDVYCYDKKN